MSDVLVTAVLAGIGTLIGAVIGGVVLLIAARGKEQRQRDRSALGPLRDALDRQERDVERRDAHILELGLAYDDLYEENVACLIAEADLHSHAVRCHDFCVRAAAALTKLGQDVGPPPDVPARRERPDRKEAEVRRRQLQQSTQLLQKKSHPPSPAPLPPSGGKTS